MRGSQGLFAITTAVAAAGSAFAQSESTIYTATKTKSVYAAQATAKTSSPVSHVEGKAFDRLAIIWLENTDYELAVNDRECLALVSFFLSLPADVTGLTLRVVFPH